MKVWISYAGFEASAMENDVGGLVLPEEEVPDSLCDQKLLCLQCARSKRPKHVLKLMPLCYYFIYDFVLSARLNLSSFMCQGCLREQSTTSEHLNLN